MQQDRNQTPSRFSGPRDGRPSGPRQGTPREPRPERPPKFWGMYGDVVLGTLQAQSIAIIKKDGTTLFGKLIGYDEYTLTLDGVTKNPVVVYKSDISEYRRELN